MLAFEFAIQFYRLITLRNVSIYRKPSHYYQNRVYPDVNDNISVSPDPHSTKVAD